MSVWIFTPRKGMDIRVGMDIHIAERGWKFTSWKGMDIVVDLGPWSLKADTLVAEGDGH